MSQADDDFDKWYDDAKIEGIALFVEVDKSTARFIYDAGIMNCEQRIDKFKDALDYAMDYMDEDQRHWLRTELWPELFTQENNHDD